jgi:hypothetical protein
VAVAGTAISLFNEPSRPTTALLALGASLEVLCGARTKLAWRTPHLNRGSLVRCHVHEKHTGTTQKPMAPRRQKTMKSNFAVHAKWISGVGPHEVDIQLL